MELTRKECILQKQARESGKTVTINWTMSLSGGDSDDSEANDFTLPSSFTGGSATGQLVFSPRTSESAAAPTSIAITTSDILIYNSDATYEDTESFSIELASNDANAVAADHSSTKVLHKYDITNKDDPPVIAFTSSAVSINENPDDGPHYEDFEFKIADSALALICFQLLELIFSREAIHEPPTAAIISSLR